MHTEVLRRLLLAQAPVWLGVLAALAWIEHRELGGKDFAVAAILLTSVASLSATCAYLGAGKRIADGITLARAALVVGATGVIGWSGQVHWLAWGCLAVGVLADLVDGWAARRFGGSDAGAVLDMEADQVSVTLLATVGVIAGGVGVALLTLPAMRWVYVLYVAAIGSPPHDPKPRDGDNRRGRLICAGVMAALLFCTAPGDVALAKEITAIVAILVLAWSFGSDAVFLWSRAPRSRSLPSER